jgi:hypothetical protein
MTGLELVVRIHIRTGMTVRWTRLPATIAHPGALSRRLCPAAAAAAAAPARTEFSPLRRVTGQGIGGRRQQKFTTKVDHSFIYCTLSRSAVHGIRCR